MKDYELGNSISDIFEMLPEKRIKKVMLGNREIGIVRVGDKVYGFHAFCPHRGASLISGSVNLSEEIICPLHQYRFDLKTGQCRSSDCSDLQTIPCQLTEKGLKITIP
ncbi:Rieske (2Fe-2S) protein [Algoriphagus sp.]|uniref:Rieske (2Fe-2S) protein n=1 Tax=Algoriphagus sp. TaxID=1872435 RepID=UPI003918F1CC